MFDLVELQEYSRTAAGFDPDLADSSELRSGVTALAVSEALIAAAKAHLVAKLDARAVTLVDDGSSFVLAARSSHSVSSSTSWGMVSSVTGKNSPWRNS